MLKILVCGYNHFQFVEKIARGFQACSNCNTRIFLHDYHPVAKAGQGNWAKRFLHKAKIKAVNKGLLKVTDEFEPDLVVCIEGSCIEPETILAVRRKASIIAWALDPLKRLPLNREALRLFNVVLCFDPVDVQALENGLYMPLGFDPKTYHPLKNETPHHDVIWVGSGHADRREKLNKIARNLAERGLELAVYGKFYKKKHTATFTREWPALASAIRRNDKISPSEANILYNQAYISLNMHIDEPGSLGLNLRTFEVPGAGSLLLTDYKESLLEFFEPGEEVMVYEEISEIPEICSSLLRNKTRCEQIAASGHARAVREHSFANRCRRIIDNLLPGGTGNHEL